MLKSLLGIARQWNCEKFAILSVKPRSHGNRETSKTKVNYSVESVGLRELALFFKFFTIARENTPLTIGIVSRADWGNLLFWPGMGERVVLWPDSKSRGWPKYLFSWFEIGLKFSVLFSAVTLFKCSKYSFFFGVDFSLHGSSPSLGV